MKLTKKKIEGMRHTLSVSIKLASNMKLEASN